MGKFFVVNFLLVLPGDGDLVLFDIVTFLVVIGADGAVVARGIVSKFFLGTGVDGNFVAVAVLERAFGIMDERLGSFVSK